MEFASKGAVGFCWGPVCGGHPGDGPEDVGFHVVPRGGGGGKGAMVVVFFGDILLRMSRLVCCSGGVRCRKDGRFCVVGERDCPKFYILVLRQCWSAMIS